MPTTPMNERQQHHLREADRLIGVDTLPKPSSGAATAQAQPESAARSESISSGTESLSKQARLDALRQDHDSTCPLCTTWTGYTQTVFGVGNPDAELMFIGEAPGEQEDLSGEPFVGRAGQKLNEIIKAMGLSREEVYIANVLKSRPPENRTPQQHEVDACGPFLIEQIRIIQPSVIVTLGGPATKIILDTNIGITRLRGQWATFHPRQLGADHDPIPVMPTFHPAYLLRNYTPDTRQKVWADMQQVMERLGIGT